MKVELNAEDKRDCFELRRNQNGFYSWTTTVYGESVTELIDKANAINQRAEDKWGKRHD